MIATHSPDCWRDPDHHGCAVARLQALLRVAHDWRDNPDAALSMSWTYGTTVKAIIEGGAGDG